MNTKKRLRRIATLLIVVTLLSASLVLSAPTSMAYSQVTPTTNVDFVADAPWQVTDSGVGSLYLPLLVQIMDCDQSSIFLNRITVSDGSDASPSVYRDYGETINDHIWYDFFNPIDDPTDIDFADYDVDDNKIHIEVVFLYDTILTKTRDVYVELRGDDLPTSAAFSDFYRTSTHTHSNYTDDTYEFGPILDASGVSAYSAAADAQGIDFIAITDHSYDVSSDDWTDFNTAISEANDNDYTSQLIVGQEISCGNGGTDGTDAGHLLTYNADYIDTGQGVAHAAEPDYDEEWVLDELEDDSLQNVAYIAHPYDAYGEQYNGWEWNFDEDVMGEDQWNTIDTWFDGTGGTGAGSSTNDVVLRGLKIWNYGCTDTSNALARNEWIDLLDNEIVAFAIGGTDSHNMGNGDTTFGGIYGTPAYFGAVTTLVYTDVETPESDDIVTGLREGRTIVSDGPVVNFEVNDGSSDYMIGDRAPGSTFTIDINYATTDDFGDFTKITIYLNRIDSDPNSIEWKHEITDGISGGYGTLEDLNQNTIFDPDHSFSRSFGDYYIRVEGETTVGEVTHYSYTNPIWLDKSGIGTPSNLPDLVVESITLPEELPGVVSAVILNIGPSFAYSDNQSTAEEDFQGFYVSFFDLDYSLGKGWNLAVVTPLHTNRVVLAPPHVMSSTAVFGLDSGERVTVYATWTEPPYGSDDDGETLWVFVDWYDTTQESQQFETDRSDMVTELDETNNLLSQDVPVPPA